MLRHGFHPPEARPGGSIQIAQSVHPKRRTPESGKICTLFCSAARHTDRARYRPVGRAHLVFQPQDLSHASHRHSLGRLPGPPLASIAKEARTTPSLRETTTQRQGGRLQIKLADFSPESPADIKSVSVADFRRNPPQGRPRSLMAAPAWLSMKRRSVLQPALAPQQVHAPFDAQGGDVALPHLVIAADLLDHPGAPIGIKA